MSKCILKMITVLVELNNERVDLVQLKEQFL